MRAEQAQYPDRQKVNKVIITLFILLTLKYLPTEMVVFVWKKNCSKSPSDVFRTMNQSCFCANIFPSCNINSRSFSRSAMSAFFALHKFWASFLASVIRCLEMIVTGFVVILVAAVKLFGSFSLLVF